MAKRKRTRQNNSRGDFDDVRPSRRTKKWRRRIVVSLLLLVGLVVAVPTIVSQTALHNALIGRSLPDGWQVESDSASFGWARAQKLQGLRISDAQGKPLLAVENLTLSKPLLSLVINRADLGKVEVNRPTAYLETRQDGSNWEDLLTELLAQPQGNSKQKIQLDVEIVDGAVRGLDQVTGQQWSLDQANVKATVGDAMQASGNALLSTNQNRQQGQLKFRWQPNPNGEQQVELLADRLPLGPLEPWLARALPGTQLAGALSTDTKLNWRVDPQRGLQLQTSGRLEASQIALTADALMGDRLRVNQASAPWKLNIVDNQLTIEQLTFNSDWANFAASGSLDLADLQTLSLDNLPKQPTQLSGTVDLAQLAAMLPTTLQLRQDVHIDSGKLQFDASGQPKGGRFAWQAKATLQNVSGTNGQRRIRWEQPIEAVADIGESSSGPQVEQLTITSAFGNAKFQTARESVTGEFQLDLDQFSQQLSQFVDLQAWQLRGLGEGTFRLTRQPNQQFAAAAKVDLTDLHVSEGDRQIWAESKLQVDLDASGAQQEFKPISIAKGKVNLRGPRDQFEVELLEPVDLRVAQAPWRLRVEGNGPLALWAGRARPWVARVPERLEGDAHLSARVQVTSEAVHVVESTGSVVQLRMQNGPMSIDEPRVEFSGDAAWNRQTGSVESRELQLLGSSFSLRGRDFAVALAEQGSPTARGDVAFRADLERLAAIAGLVGQPQSTWPRGTAVGQLKLNSNTDQVQADYGMKIEQLELARMTAATGAFYGKPEIVWQEPMLEVTGAATYAIAQDRAQLANLQVRGQTLSLNSSVTVDRVSNEGLLQASGLVEYDPIELAKLVASYAGQGVQLQGDRQVRFQVAGPLFASAANAATHWSHRWDVTAEAGWASAGAYGLPLGGGRLNGTLRDGQLQFAPLDIAVGGGAQGQGRFTAQPLLRLLPGSEQLVLTRGPLVSNVAISQEVSERMLKYVAPILAGATRVDGQFSVALDRTQIPLRQPKQARVQGQLLAHRLNVSPGPMMNQLITLVKQVESLTKRKQFLQAATAPRTKSFLTMAEQQVDFQVVEGRVYHRNLEFLIDDAPIRSRGSVGFDQTLALEIEVPIQDRWIQSEPALRGFAGQSLRIPIYGTFQKPRIDERAIADLSKQLLQGAAQQAIGDELNRQFEKLFGR